MKKAIDKTAFVVWVLNSDEIFFLFIVFSLFCCQITHNGLALGEEADFEAPNCLPALNLPAGSQAWYVAQNFI